MIFDFWPAVFGSILGVGAIKSPVLGHPGSVRNVLSLVAWT